MLTIRAAAERLGLREATLRSWVLQRRIQFCKLGRSVRISEAEIDRIIQRGTVPPRQSAA